MYEMVKVLVQPGAMILMGGVLGFFLCEMTRPARQWLSDEEALRRIIRRRIKDHVERTMDGKVELEIQDTVNRILRKGGRSD